MIHPIEQSTVHLFQRLSRIAALVAMLIGGMGLAGWILDNELLKSVLRGGVSMKPNAAIALLAAGTSLLLHNLTPRAATTTVAKALAGFAAILGGLTLTEHVSGVDLGIDQLLFVEAPGAPATASPGRMGPPASLTFLLFGLALLVTDSRRKQLGPLLAMGACCALSIPLMGYGYGVHRLYVIPRYSGIALHTAVGLFVLGIGIILARPEFGVMRVLCTAGPGGAMARRLLLPALLIPFLVSWLVAAGVAHEWFNLDVAQPFSVLFLSICSVGLILLSARMVTSLERKRVVVEQERARLTARTDEILNNLNDSFYTVDAEGRVTNVNRRAESLWGKTRREVLGQALATAWPELAAAGVQAHTEALRSRETKRYDVYAESVGRWFELSLYPDGNDGLVCFSRDVTARRKAEADLRAAKEEAEQANRAKSEFLATLSHEMRTPLTPVLLTLPLLEEHPDLPPELRSHVEAMRRNVELEVRLISDLLDLTRVERGKLQLEVAEVDVHAVLRSAIEICREAESAPIELELTAKHHWVRGDFARLHQVFWNIVSNAQKYTERTGRIVVRTESPSPEGGLAILVTDTGRGIPAEQLPRLFTAFEQGDTRTARQRSGLGLGLAIARRIVEMHEGRISATSAGLGQGSTFSVWLPSQATNATVPTGPTITPETANGGGLHVLLVEDHPPTLKALARILGMMGHRVTTATSVAEACAAADKSDCDFLISDLGLPDGSGLDVIRHCRKRFASRAVALSGFGMENDVLAAKEAGFTEHLTKPVPLAVLRGTIARIRQAGAADEPVHRA